MTEGTPRRKGLLWFCSLRVQSIIMEKPMEEELEAAHNTVSELESDEYWYSSGFLLFMQTWT